MGIFLNMILHMKYVYLILTIFIGFFLFNAVTKQLIEFTKQLIEFTKQ